MPYQHDVFISYKRDPFGDEWPIDYFLPIFRFKVRQAIAAETDRTPQSIFLDQTDLSPAQRAFEQQGIEPGQNWRNALADALRRSRCVVALWSPYISSEFNRAEWQAFARSNKDRLFPVLLNRSEGYPEEVRRMQAMDLSEFAFVGEGFSKTEGYVEFQKAVRRFVDAVAARIGDKEAQPAAEVMRAPA